MIATPTWPSCPVFCVDHDRPAPGEDESERAESLGEKRAQVLGPHCVDREKLGHQPLNALVDLVADHAHRLDVLPGGIVEIPVLVALAGIDRAGIAAAHRDHGVGGLRRTRR